MKKISDYPLLKPVHFLIKEKMFKRDMDGQYVQLEYSNKNPKTFMEGMNLYTFVTDEKLLEEIKLFFSKISIGIKENDKAIMTFKFYINKDNK